VLFHENVADVLQSHCENISSPEYITDEKSPVGSETQANIRLKNSDLLNFVKSSTGAGSEWALEWTLVSSIALFEAFVSDIAELVYLSDPNKFLLTEQSDSPSIKLELLLNSNSKEEAIEKYIEQKLIGIFYGDPRAAFIQYNKKNEAIDGALKIDTGNYLDRRCKMELALYLEMTKRRNVIVHNTGIVNNRYIKEVPDDNINKLQLNQKVKIDRNYLFSGINALYKLARFYTIKATHTAQQTEDRNLLEYLEKQFK
jgi:hypothetical protein